MYCQGIQIYMPFCFILIQRSLLPKGKKSPTWHENTGNKKKSQKIGKQTLINPANTSRTATAKSNTTKIKRRRVPMLIPSRE